MHGFHSVEWGTFEKLFSFFLFAVSITDFFIEIAYQI